MHKIQIQRTFTNAANEYLFLYYGVYKKQESHFSVNETGNN